MQVVFIAILLLLAAPLGAAGSSVLTMKVEHLACSACAEKFKEALSSVCKDLDLDPKKGEALCRYEEPVTAKDILKKANKTGLPTKCVGAVRLED